jgi:hypothetical protein
MVLDAVSNFVRGSTDASVDSTQTTVSVVDASIFPDPSTEGEYNVVIWDVDAHPRPDQDPAVEILRVTGRDTTNDDLTVTRGQETTAGASHPSGSAVHLSPTAKMFGDIDSTIQSFWDDTNQELTADVNNQSVNTDVSSITNVASVAYPTTDQTISSASNTKMQFDSTEVNDASVLDADTTNNKIVVQEAGTYVVQAVIGWRGDSNWSNGDFANTQVFLNGTRVAHPQRRKIGTGAQGKRVMYTSDLSSGDEVEIYGYQDSGADQTTRGDSVASRIEVVRLG